MKKKAIVYLAFAAALTAVSCQKEAMKEAETTPTGEGMTISAVSEGIGAETKAAMVYKYDVVWKTGDKICVKNSEKSVEFTLTGGEETTKGTFSSGESISGDVEGFYPSSIVTDGGLVWPAEQGSKQICPMYCKKTLSSTQNQTFNFASLGSVLQLNFNSTTADIVLKSIEVKADEAMSGAFTVENGQAKVSQPEGDKPGITLDLGEGLALGTSAKKFNIAVPAGKYHGLSIVLRATNGKKCIINAKKDKVIEIVYNTVTTLAISGEFKLDLPADALPGVFTVSNDDGVTKRPIFFSKGNLYCSGVEFYTDEAEDKDGTVKSMANAQWGFEANQYDTTPSSSGIRDTTHISHFMWCADATNAMALKFEDEWYGFDITFFAAKNFTVNGYSGWHTLSTKEWQYLFAWNSTLNSGRGGFDENLPRYGLINYGVTVCGKANCVVLLPDNWEWDESTVGTDWQKNTSDIIEYSEETTIKWSTMQDAGAVCLPAAGSRSGSPHSLADPTVVSNVGDYGYYWSSTANLPGTAYSVGFNSYTVSIDVGSRNYGNSVRLVTESK